MEQTEAPTQTNQQHHLAEQTEAPTVPNQEPNSSSTEQSSLLPTGNLATGEDTVSGGNATPQPHSYHYLHHKNERKHTNTNQ